MHRIKSFKHTTRIYFSDLCLQLIENLYPDASALGASKNLIFCALLFGLYMLFNILMRKFINLTGTFLSDFPST